MDDSESFLLGDFSSEEAASGIESGFLPFTEVCVGQINGRASFVLAGAVQTVEQHILCPVVFGQNSAGGSSFPVGHVRCDLLAALSVPDDAVTVNGFLFGFRNEKPAAVLADSNIGIGKQKMLQQE